MVPFSAGVRVRFGLFSPYLTPQAQAGSPASIFFFLFVTGIKGSLFTLILLEPSVRNTFKMTAIRDKS